MITSCVVPLSQQWRVLSSLINVNQFGLSLVFSCDFELLCNCGLVNDQNRNRFSCSDICASFTQTLFFVLTRENSLSETACLEIVELGMRQCQFKKVFFFLRTTLDRCCSILVVRVGYISLYFTVSCSFRGSDTLDPHCRWCGSTRAQGSPSVVSKVVF